MVILKNTEVLLTVQSAYVYISDLVQRSWIHLSNLYPWVLSVFIFKNRLDYQQIN